MRYEVEKSKFVHHKEVRYLDLPDHEIFYCIRCYDGRNSYPLTFYYLGIKGLEKEEFINASHCRGTNVLLFETEELANAAILMLELMGRLRR